MLTDEVLGLMRDILTELHEINWKLDDIRGSGAFNSISDVNEKLENLKESVDAISSNGEYTLMDIVQQI